MSGSGLDAGTGVEDRGRPPSADGGRVLGFCGAMAFQWINPKGWMIALSAAGLFARADEALWVQGVRIGAVFFAVGRPCMMPWMLPGAEGGRVAGGAGTVADILRRDGRVVDRFNLAWVVGSITDRLCSPSNNESDPTSRYQNRRPRGLAIFQRVMGPPNLRQGITDDSLDGQNPPLQPVE